MMKRLLNNQTMKESITMITQATTILGEAYFALDAMFNGEKQLIGGCTITRYNSDLFIVTRGKGDDVYTLRLGKASTALAIVADHNRIVRETPTNRHGVTILKANGDVKTYFYQGV